MKTYNALSFGELHFGRGDYQVTAMPSASTGSGAHILTVTAPHSDEKDARYIPTVDLSPLLTLTKRHHRLVTSALVRAGARHPGLDDLSLRDLHRLAHDEGHVELFCDINVLSTGLIKQLVDSLGRRCCRVVVSSSSIDILHEHEIQRPVDWDTALMRSEMSRHLTVLEELRSQVAVHVHPLRPGTSRYMKRAKAEPQDDSEEREGQTYVSEDRLMVSAFWDYIQTTIPRVPVRLVTSDHILARVCAAERAPFVFAKTPYDVWWKEELKEGRPAAPALLWVDPYAMAYRHATLHRILWELALVYNKLHVRVSPRPEDNVPAADLVTTDFVLVFNPWKHRPGSRLEISIGRPDEMKGTKPAVPLATAEPPKRKLKLSLLRVFEVMPTRVGGRVPLSDFKQKGEDSLRQLAQIGQATDLFAVSDKWVEGLPGLDRLLAALHRRDYIELNEIFRKLPAYDDVLREASEQKPFPNNKVGGAITGWAVILGAAYKTAPEGVRFGLAELTEDNFEAAVARYHNEIGKGERAVLLPPILDRACRSLQISPIRFEAILDATIGKRALADYELQRATVRYPIPSHDVIVAPSSAASASYIREFDPGAGITIGNKFSNVLVARSARGTTL